MAGFLDKFREKIAPSAGEEKSSQEEKNIDADIALGVLLWMVAQADDQFLKEEEDKIKEVLQKHCQLSEEDLPVVLESVKIAERDKIDLYTFAREVSQDLPYPMKVSLVENLFRVACADDDLDHDEHEMIRKISGLLGVDHKDFIESKIKVKKEYGMKTA